MKDYLVSIIVPIYNAERYLSECIKSVIALQDERWQLILVNDGSEDGSADICKWYCEKDIRILYLEQENRGVSAARNNGIKHALGEWITFLDSDDMLSPDMFHLLNLASLDDDMIIARNTRIKDGFTWDEECHYVSSVELQKSILNLKKFKSERKDIVSITDYDHWSSCGRFYRNKILQANNIEYPVGVKVGEDLLFCMKYAQNINRVIVNNSMVYYYRVNNESVTHHFHKDWDKEIIKQVYGVIQCVCNYELHQYLNKFIINRITECCVCYYCDLKCGLNTDQAAKKMKNLCESHLFQKAISECDYGFLASGKKNYLYSAITLWFLKRKWYKSLIRFIKVLRKYL